MAFGADNHTRDPLVSVNMKNEKKKKKNQLLFFVQ